MVINMKIIVIGCGKIGRAIINNVVKEGHDIVAVDTNANIIDDVVNKYDVSGICGNGATLDIQKEADVKHADLVIATTSDDATNILTCLTAKKLGAKSTILRVRDPEYIDQMLMMKEELGLSMIVNPEMETAEEIYNLISIPGVDHLERFGKGRIYLFDLNVSETSVLAHKTLIEIVKYFTTKVLIGVVIRNKEVIVPNGHFKVLPGDHLYICSESSTLADFLKESGNLQQPVKKIMMVGGGRIGYYLGKKLQKSKVKMTIVEINKKFSEQLAIEFPKFNIINADGSMEDVLIEEGIEGMDAVLSLTNIDEQNIMISMLAKKLGINKVITKLKRDSYSSIMDRIDISNPISPKDVVCNRIVGYIRALQNKKGSNVVNVYKLLNGQIEAIEFEAKKKERFYGKPLKQLKLKEGIIVSAIIRNYEVIIPNGSTTIEQNDSVIIISLNQSLDDLADIIL